MRILEKILRMRFECSVFILINTILRRARSADDFMNTSGGKEL